MAVLFFSISDDYISLITAIDNKVLSNHELNRTHIRPYVSFLININKCHYFLPLSSPDKEDYDSLGILRHSTNTILKMHNNSGGFIEKILLNNMIPVPISQISPISLVKFDLTKISNSKLRIEAKKENDYRIY